MSSAPLLSVCLITYNHGSFIREALDGIVAQKVTFPWEIIVADDFSTDNTREIINEYAGRYPHLFKLIFQEKNVGPHRNWMDLMYAAHAKYVAYQEGDDIWNDPLKLQKQVDFLEANPQYVLSCHDARVIDQNGTILQESKLPESERRDYSSDELKSGAFILSVTMCFRNVVGKFPEEYFRVKNGDTLLVVLLVEHGACKFQSEIIPASYRKHTGGLWSMKADIIRWRTQVNSYDQFSRYFRRKGDQKFALYYLDLYVKKQLDIYRWEKTEGDALVAKKTMRNTLRAVFRAKGIRTAMNVAKQFLQLQKATNA